MRPAGGVAFEVRRAEMALRVARAAQASTPSLEGALAVARALAAYQAAVRKLPPVVGLPWVRRAQA